MIYIIAQRELPMPEPRPVFRVDAVQPEQARQIRTVTDGTFIAVAGSWQGCGCGFCYESIEELRAVVSEIPDEEARIAVTESREDGLASVGALRAYLHDACRRVGIVRVYVVWAGEEGRLPEREATVTPEHFGGDAFCFHDPEVFVVSPSATAA